LRRPSPRASRLLSGGRAQGLGYCDGFLPHAHLNSACPLLFGLHRQRHRQPQAGPLKGKFLATSPKAPRADSESSGTESEHPRVTADFTESCGQGVREAQFVERPLIRADSALKTRYDLRYAGFRDAPACKDLGSRRWLVNY
jgi:hypothetical protein